MCCGSFSLAQAFYAWEGRRVSIGMSRPLTGVLLVGIQEARKTGLTIPRFDRRQPRRETPGLVKTTRPPFPFRGELA